MKVIIIFFTVIFSFKVFSANEFGGDWFLVNSSDDNCNFIGDGVLKINFKSAKLKVDRWSIKSTKKFNKRIFKGKLKKDLTEIELKSAGPGYYHRLVGEVEPDMITVNFITDLKIAEEVYGDCKFIFSRNPEKIIAQIKKSNDNTSSNSSIITSAIDFGQYEVINYPLEMGKKLIHKDPLRVAGAAVVFRFIKKKSSLSKYPHKLMEGMAWMEVLYNEKIKPPKKAFEDMTGLLEARNSMRESVGLDINVSAQDAIDTYWMMSILLSKTKYEKRDVDPALLERKKALNDLKTALRKAKEKYLEEVQGDKS